MVWNLIYKYFTYYVAHNHVADILTDVQNHIHSPSRFWFLWVQWFACVFFILIAEISGNRTTAKNKIKNTLDTKLLHYHKNGQVVSFEPSLEALLQIFSISVLKKLSFFWSAQCIYTGYHPIKRFGGKQKTFCKRSSPTLFFQLGAKPRLPKLPEVNTTSFFHLHN